MSSTRCALVCACILTTATTSSAEAAHLRRKEDPMQRQKYGGERPVPGGTVNDLWQHVNPDVDDIDVSSLWADLDADDSSLALPEHIVNNVYTEQQLEEFTDQLIHGNNQRIVGGNAAAVGKYPFFTMILRYKSKKNTYFKGGCGASLVGNCHVVTAAHCIRDSRLHLNDAVLVGALEPFANNQNQPFFFSDLKLHNYSNTVDPDKAFIRHPNWDPSTNRNDVGLLKLDKCVDIDRFKPIKLARPDYEMKKDQDIDIMGFGDTTSDPNDEEEDVTFLRAVTVPYISHQECNDIYYSGVTNDTICAGFKEGQKDSCQGDSGGPAVDFSSGEAVQVGITSWGVGCALPNSPGVYASVAHHWQWIHDRVCYDPDTDQSIDLCGVSSVSNNRDDPACDGSSNKNSFTYGGIGGTQSIGCTWVAKYNFFCDLYESARRTCPDACVCR